MRRWPVLGFFLIAIGWSWAAWIPAALSQTGGLGWRVPAEVIWLGEYGPSVAALIVTWRLDGGAGVRALLRRVLRWRVDPGWYLTVLLLTPAAAALVAVVAAAAGQALPGLGSLGNWEARFVARTAAFTPSMGLVTGLVSVMERGTVPAALVFALLAITNGGVSEELGWRGFAGPRLERRWNALGASLGVGVLWALWHTGTGFWQALIGSDAGAAARFAGGYLLQYLVLVLPLAVIYGWVVNSTGSLLLAILLHASYNMTIIVATAAWPVFPLAWLVVLLWVIAAGVVVVAGPARLARPGGSPAGTDQSSSPPDRG